MIVSPNVGNAKNAIYRLMGKKDYRDLGDYARGGVHGVNEGMLRRWLSEAGCAVEKMKWVATPRLKNIAGRGPALLDSLLGAEIIARARKAG